MATKKTTAKKPPAKTVTPVAAKPKFMKPHELVNSSNAQNAIGMAAWGKFAGEADIGDIANCLHEKTQKVTDGDMKQVESMLFMQAKSLETIFTNLATRAAQQVDMKWLQTLLTLSLKAQAQCRSTLEALAEVKNPRAVAFVKQANISNGPQQVNNGSQQLSRTETIQSEPNKLLEADHGQRMDIGAQGQAGRVNQTVAAVG
jgi:hypothetical protein